MEVEKLSETENSILQIAHSKLGKVFKLILEGTPYINTVYTAIVGSIEKKSLLIFLNKWVDEKIDEKFDENNPEQVELITHAVLKAIRCSKKGQIHKIVGILKGKFEGRIESFGDAEDLINLVSELSEAEALVLKNMYDIYNDKVRGKYEQQGAFPANISTYDLISVNQKEMLDLLPQLKNKIVFLCGRLNGKGLIKEGVTKLYNQPGNDRKDYYFTFIGITLMSANIEN